MVVTHLYTCTGTEIGTKIGIYKAESREGKDSPYFAYLSGLVGLSVGSFHFGSLWFGLVQIF